MLSPECPFGPRIVEFDEEQHFSPFRYATLGIIKKTIEVDYDLGLYRGYCRSAEHFERFARKHRLRGMDVSEATTSQDFLAALAKSGNLSGNGFVSPKPCFPFVGGRIAQRAYYDCLRDFFHRSPPGVAMGLKPILRVSIYQVEERVGCALDKAEQCLVTEAVSSIVNSLVSDGPVKT